LDKKWILDYAIFPIVDGREVITGDGSFVFGRRWLDRYRPVRTGSVFVRTGTRLNLKTTPQPRMDTDGHGYHAVAKTRRFIWQVKDKPVSKSVFIHVNPWLKTVLSNSNCGN